MRRLRSIKIDNDDTEGKSSIKVCPFVCRRALLGLQPGIPFKDRPSDDPLFTNLGNCSLTEYVYLKYHLEDLGDPVGGKDDKEADEGTGDHFFAFFLGFFVGGAGEHGEAAHDQHTKEDEPGDSQEVGKETTDDPAKGVGFDGARAVETESFVVGVVVDVGCHIN